MFVPPQLAIVAWHSAQTFRPGGLHNSDVTRTTTAIAQGCDVSALSRQRSRGTRDAAFKGRE
jgi:hypothetical protein